MVRGLLGVMLLWIVVAGTALAQDVTESAPGEPVVHRVTYGDTLYSIANRYGVTIDEIAQANGIANTWNIKIGDTLTIPSLIVPDDSAVVENPLIAGTPVEHVIRPGETLAAIANQYGVTTDLILRANNIANPNLIYYGQVLNIWVTTSITDSSTSTNQPAEIVIPLTHQVRSGEILSQIAARYDVPLNELIVANGILNPDRVMVGDVLMIPGHTVTDAAYGTTGDALAEIVAPQPTITDGKQIVVDLSDQRIYAFDNGVLVFSALVSTGLPATPTVLGDYEIYHRLGSQTMYGPGYYLPGVQWVQYFYEGYALHGTYWHDNFGEPMSHGCVNLTTADALWLYNWASAGTPVHVKL